MKNDKYYGSLRSRDNQWGVGFEFCQKSGYYHYLYTHDIFSMTVNKLALSANDDKRLICENKINTKALR